MTNQVRMEKRRTGIKKMLDSWADSDGILMRMIQKVVIGHGTDPCWFWQGAKSSNYGVIRFQNESRYAHRVSYILAEGLDSTEDIPGQINHSCGIKNCVNPDHLRSGTRRSNAVDALKMNEFDTKIDSDDAHLIRELNERDKMTQCEIADIFDISQATVSQVVNSKTWSHVD